MHPVIGVVVVDVRRTTMPSDVHSSDFVLRRDAQQAESSQQPKERRHCGRHPTSDAQDFEDLRGEELASAAHEEPMGSAAIAAVNFQNVVLLGEEAHKEHTPGATASVQLRGF